jgi:hypothetical protein
MEVGSIVPEGGEVLSLKQGTKGSRPSSLRTVHARSIGKYEYRPSSGVHLSSSVLLSPSRELGFVPSPIIGPRRVLFAPSLAPSTSRSLAHPWDKR